MKKFFSAILALAMILSMITIVQAADFSGGGYNFVCADGGRYLNVYAGKDADGTNVCVWERDGSPEQNYTISACGGGKYKLYPASSSSRVIDVNRGNSYDNPLKAGLNVDLWRTNDAPAQEFYITHVGDNLYKIELAALPGHVLQANNPNKNNGNVTLEKYTGANNQHWKILKNGTQVTEPCTHDSISSSNERISYKQKNDNAHSVVKVYDKVCDDCGKTIKSDVTETTMEKHSLSDNYCSKCGYELIVEECTHSKTHDDMKSNTVEQKNDKVHSVVKIYDKVCDDCGKTIKSDVTETTMEKHSLSDNYCSKCGYELIVEECTHSKTYDDVKSHVAEQKNDTHHTVTDTYDVYCSDCEELIKKDATKTYDEKHTMSNGVCKKCNYTAEVAEDAKCKHANTEKRASENKKSVISVKDDNQHTTVSYYNLYCTDCDTYIDKNLSEIADENHKFVNNICSVCKFEKTVEKPASTTISASKTTVAPGEKISLTWPKADRATAYDIHIEKPGVDTPYRVDYEFVGTSATVVIDDEGTYRLTIYPTNSAGYIRGGSVTVTVKKAVPEKTASVKDGLYNIKNVSSGYMMNVYAGEDANGTKVTMWQNDDSNDQKIYISHQGDGKYLLKYNSSSNGRVIDVNRGNSMSASIDDGDKIDIWTSNDPEAQLLYINDCGNGTFTFELASKPGYVIAPVSVSGAKTNGSQLELKKDINADYQKWYIVSSSAVQKTDSITVRTSAPEKNNKYYYSNSNIFYACGLAPYGSRIPYAKGNCTWYAWGRAYELTGTKPQSGLTGNAYTWWNGAAGKYSRGTTPKVGAIAVWKSNMPYSGGCGHVAIVEKIENGKVYISESGYPNTAFRYREIYSTQYLYGYIYIK